VIYHFCPRADWESAASSGSYTADTLARQGFIHCSPRDHVHVSATMRARGRSDLVVLEIDEARLDAPSVWEEGDPPLIRMASSSRTSMARSRSGRSCG
jgi:uncharacterized protein (DUF952 family)